MGTLGAQEDDDDGDCGEYQIIEQEDYDSEDVTEQTSQEVASGSGNLHDRIEQQTRKLKGKINKFYKVRRPSGDSNENGRRVNARQLNLAEIQQRKVKPR